MSDALRSQGIQSSWLDGMMVFMLVVAVGSTCTILLLRDLNRYWNVVGGALEAAGGAAVGAPPKPTATPETSEAEGP